VRIFYLSPRLDVPQDIYRVLAKLLDADREFDGWESTPWWEHWKPGPAVEEIINAISGADIVVADITDDNPNVMYEVGVARALMKPVILLKSEASGETPFDLKHLQHVPYDSGEATVGEANEPKVKEGLKKSLLAALPEVDRGPVGGGARVTFTERVDLQDLKDGDEVFVPSKNTEAIGRVEVVEIRNRRTARVAIRFADGLVLQQSADSPEPIQHLIFRLLRWAPHGSS
jgi:hypothetical protein